MTWRAAWADVSNRYLERAGREERIDHRSNTARGLDEIPTIHEGVAAQALERKGIISDRRELNRQIKSDNKQEVSRLLREESDEHLAKQFIIQHRKEQQNTLKKEREGDLVR